MNQIKITNFSTGEIISEKAIICNNFQKARGLMFSSKKTLLFGFKNPRKISLHMFFVFFPIDVIFLDSNKKVIEIKENFKPFTTYAPKLSASYAIEMPYGTVNATRTKLNNRLVF